MINMNPIDSAASKEPLYNYINGHITVYPFLELSFGAIELFLTDTLLYTQIDSLTRRDTIVNNVSCSSFCFWADNILIEIGRASCRERV